jgi:hypothetical protein
MIQAVNVTDRRCSTLRKSTYVGSAPGSPNRRLAQLVPSGVIAKGDPLTGLSLDNLERSDTL